MKQLLHYLLGLMVCASAPILIAEKCGFTECERLPAEKIKVSPCGLRTLFLPRSQGSNTARRLAGWEYVLPGCDDRVWGDFWATVQYERSLKPERLAQYFFGSTCLHFKGSQVADRNPDTDLLADNFGLPTTFIGTACFKPRIENWILDFNFHMGLDQWCYGLYFKVRFPVVRSRWDIGLHCNETSNIGPNEIPVFPNCYMGNCLPTVNAQGAVCGIPGVVLTAQTIREALSDCSNFSQTGSSISSVGFSPLEKEFSFGDMKEPQLFGRISPVARHTTQVADVDFILGWNFLLQRAAHFGLFLQVTAPAGNKPSGEFVFEPIVGNGRHWELGGGISAHACFINNSCHSLGIYFEGFASYQFKKFQVRTFDICGRGPLSRYMLLKEFNEDNSYAGRLIQAVDYTTRATRAGGSIRGDATVKLSYYRDRWGVDVGYNVWGRGNEKLRIQNDLYPSDLLNRRFGIKGTEGVCVSTPNPLLFPPLNSTQSCATITRGASVDNPVILPGATTWNGLPAFVSNPPVILCPDDLDLRSGAIPSQLTHSFFTHISYMFVGCCWEPQFGLGAQIEYDGKPNILSSLNKWGVWFKAGIAF